ncbi:hypothetical protein HPP92_020760 [Vanilla planifolia]|uniref:Thioredoxin domain-containing protein n=1 Tax=Vanilla planifolia TaxID=51239 RepID=A0A835UGH5_VANPL|nr:hypothetical protein HPP92_020760 [Vanilla planifolia]
MASKLSSASLLHQLVRLHPTPSTALTDLSACPFIPFPRRLEASTSSPASASIVSLQVSLPHRTRTLEASVAAWSGLEEARLPEDQLEDDAPSSIELLPVTSEEQFDRIIAEAQQHDESFIVLWMANWCRKCIYLKPKLEKLAADYYPRIRFYCVDVNTVPQKLVSRAGIIKMPTVQLYRDSQREAEIVGGDKAWLVVNDLRRMIEKEE